MARSVRKFKETVQIRSAFFQRLRCHKYIPIGAIAFGLLAAACVHVWQRVMVIELAKDVAALRAENRSLVDDVKKTSSDIAALSMASRVERYARDTLGLQPVTADRLFTLIKKSEREIPPDELTAMFSSIKRVADYLPIVTEAQASGRELRPIRFDTVAREGSAR
ncbi:MAG TPA: hypothetical protein VMY05_12155 [Acidobacteriota bacterium]|nr:hypothetical protein [Acidobacteriota bacterium]